MISKEFGFVKKEEKAHCENRTLTNSENHNQQKKKQISTKETVTLVIELAMELGHVHLRSKRFPDNSNQSCRGCAQVTA
jgi:hypothetical protein